MARMQAARWRPISRNYTARVTTKDSIILHVTAAPNATSQHGWFNTRGANASSHFHVDLVGNIEQYIDTDHMSWANRDANPRSVTIETQGGANGEWTIAQVRSIRTLIKWIRSVHKGIPLRQMTSSRRSQKGIGWHRLGCNGNFPRTGILRGRNQRGGGELWSGAYGKVCPGSDRIRQIPAIIRQVNGHWTPATSTPAVTKPAKPKGLTVSEADRIIDHINQRTTIRLDESTKKALHTGIDTWSLGQLVDLIGRRVGRTDGRVNDINNKIGEIYLLELTEAQMRALGTGIKQWTLPKLLTTLAHRAGYTFRRTANLRGEVEGLKEMVKQLAEGEGITIDYDKVQSAAKQGAKEALEEGIDIEAEVTFHNSGDDA